jgi:Ser/Thr protein kinase RdoA (MazF antagonist)
VGFVNHLADHGLDVPRALPSLAGRFVETAPAREGTVLAYAFERAKGEPIPEGEWTPRLLEDWGALMGRIHALGASWRPPAEVQRPLWHWDELDYFDRYIPPEAGPVRRRAADLMGRLLALPTGPDVFGMVHGDLHPWNFFRHEGGLSPFDFDDCARDWFIKDLASALYYALEAPPAPSSPAEWSERFRYLKHHLVTGYRREHSLSEEWLVRQLPDFLLRASLFDYVETVRLEAAGAPEQEFRTREALTEEIERDLWRDARFWS